VVGGVAISVKSTLCQRGERNQRREDAPPAVVRVTHQINNQTKINLPADCDRLHLLSLSSSIQSTNTIDQTCPKAEVEKSSFHPIALKVIYESRPSNA
jgi:hypothetical protein